MGNKLIIGYIRDTGLAEITKEEALQLTHINIAFGKVKGNEISLELKNMHCTETIREYNKDIKILLSVGGWSAGGFSEMASTEVGRKRFSESCVEVINKYNLDGVDLDWEYPCYSEAEIGSSKNDKVNFTLLLKEIRTHIDAEGAKNNRKYLLTIAAGADQYYVDGTEMDKAQEYLDYVQLMTYDMRGGFQTLTGHHTNLFTGTGDLFRISCDASARLFERAGVPKDKIVLGVAFYSRRWKDVPNVNNGLYQMCPGSGGYGPDFTELYENYINKNGFNRFWDDECKAPYLFNGNEFITYEDEESIKHKCEYVNETGLRGLMFWEYDCDKSGKLLDSLYENTR